MTTPTQPPYLQDDRWGGYVPWFLRHPDFAILSHFDLFFGRAAHRLQQVFTHDEAGNVSRTHLGDAIESDSHQCFRFNSLESLAAQIESFFAPTRIQTETNKLTSLDPLYIAAQDNFTTFFNKVQRKIDSSDWGQFMASPKYKAELKKRDNCWSTRRTIHHSRLVSERLTVLEAVLRRLKTTPAFLNLRADLRRYLAEAQIMLDIAETDGRIVPMEEALLQKEVIDRLLPRLANRFPQQEKDLVKAYHDLVQDVDTDTIFVLAIKALEEIARKVSGRPKLTLDDLKDLKAAFPNLHPTIYTTILKLAAHRGDKAGHGRQGPPPHEMRYLLFSICNVALLFLDYPSPTNPASAS
jgi:hypothetical protein